MTEPNPRGYPRHVQMKRLGCCAGWPKPCRYHEGYADAIAAAEQREAELRAEIERLNKALRQIAESHQPHPPSGHTTPALGAAAAARAALSDSPSEEKCRIEINRGRHVVPKRVYTGQQIRNLPSPPITDEYDLWRVVPGADDRLIRADELVKITDGLRFFTTPQYINAGTDSPSEGSARG